MNDIGSILSAAADMVLTKTERIGSIATFETANGDRFTLYRDGAGLDLVWEMDPDGNEPEMTLIPLPLVAARELWIALGAWLRTQETRR